MSDSRSERPDPPEKPRTILESIAELVGGPSKVLLPDSDSKHGTSPIVAPQTATDLVPRGRANYQLMGEIARGGMGSVLKGHDTDLGRDVAIKVLREDIAGNATAIQRFVEEAQIGGQLQHPGIVPVYELGLMADDRPYFTMKLVKGRTLAELLHERKDLADERGRYLAIFEAVCQTVAYAHSKKVLHRDLKPANIMVGAFGEVQVVDWGLAKVLSRGGVADEERARESHMSVVETVRSGPGSFGSQSMAGSVMGTPAYMAPEQAQGEIDKLDERADVFSLGAILCEILTGDPPYLDGEERTLVQAARAHLDPCHDRLEGCGADAELVQLCRDCLTPARDARPRNADEVARRVQAHLVSVEERAHRAEVEASEQRRARTVTTAVAGLVVLAAVFGTGAFYFVQKERAARVEFVRASVDQLHDEAIELAQGERFAEAIDVARQAVALAAGGDAAPELVARTERFLAQTRSHLDAAEREAEFAARDRELIERLEALRLELAEAALSTDDELRELDRRFVETFATYGVDLEADDLRPALERIRQREIAEEVALALDDWTAIRQSLYEADSDLAVRLIHLAIDLDRAPLRRRMRVAILEEDVETMLGLARPEAVERLTPGSVWALGSHVWNHHSEHRSSVLRMYDRALELYPDDFILRVMGGNLLTDAGRRTEGLESYAAAVSLRPRNGFARMRLAFALQHAGDIPRSTKAFEAALELSPSDADLHAGLALGHFYMGRYESALASFEAARAAGSEEAPDEMLLNRFYLGRASADEVVARASVAPMSGQMALCWGLANHPDPERRRLEFTYELSAARIRALGDRMDQFAFAIHAAVCARTGRYAEALETCDRLPVNDDLDALGTMSCIPFVRAVSLHALGREQEAARVLHVAAARAEERIARDPAAWGDSSLVRWRAFAEEALAD